MTDLEEQQRKAHEYVLQQVAQMYANHHRIKDEIKADHLQQIDSLQKERDQACDDSIAGVEGAAAKVEVCEALITDQNKAYITVLYDENMRYAEQVQNWKIGMEVLARQDEIEGRLGKFDALGDALEHGGEAAAKFAEQASQTALQFAEQASHVAKDVEHMGQGLQQIGDQLVHAAQQLGPVVENLGVAGKVAEQAGEVATRTAELGEAAAKAVEHAGGMLGFLHKIAEHVSDLGSHFPSLPVGASLVPVVQTVVDLLQSRENLPEICMASAKHMFIQTKQELQDAPEVAEQKFNDAKDSLRELAEGARNKFDAAKEVVEKAADSAQKQIDEAKDALGKAAGDVQKAVKEVKEDLQVAAEEVKKAVKEAKDDLKEFAEDARQKYAEKQMADEREKLEALLTKSKEFQVGRMSKMGLGEDEKAEMMERIKKAAQAARDGLAEEQKKRTPPHIGGKEDH